MSHLKILNVEVALLEVLVKWKLFSIYFYVEESVLLKFFDQASFDWTC
jgi:hypothetical protein